MRYIPSTKRIIVVGNSNGVTTGFETESFGKKIGDYYGVILTEPEELDEAISRLDGDITGRYFLAVTKSSEGIFIELVYGNRASSIKAKDRSIFTVIGPFDSLKQCIHFKKDFGTPDLTEREYEEAYVRFIEGSE